MEPHEKVASLSGISGELRLKVYVVYSRFLLEHATRIPGVASIKSSFALKQVKYSTALPFA